MFSKIVTLTLLLPLCASALNILAIFPHPGKSHNLVLRVFFLELVNRGHNITVITHFSEKDAPSNYQEILLEGRVTTDNDLAFKNFYALLAYMSMLLPKVGNNNCQLMLENKQVQDLIRSRTKFDVIVVQQFNSDCALGIAYKLRAPVVGISSHILMPWHYNRLGITFNPSLIPFHFLGTGTKPTLLQRVEITILDKYFNIINYFLSQRVDSAILARYFDDIPALEDLAKEIKVHLLCHHFVLTGSRIFPPNVIEIGGFNVRDSKPLTGDLKNFIDEAEAGVILISFGSLVNISTLPTDKLNALFQAMDQLPQKFIWKWNGQIPIKHNKNKVYLSNWLPQVDILGHSKIRGFLSHSGMGGITEAIHFGVPMVAMPIFGDQAANAASIEESGLGVRIEINDLTKDSLVAAFKTILEPKFRDNVKQLSKAWHDRPMSPMDTAVFWTEYAARHPSRTFRTSAADVSLFQYLLLDVMCVILLILLSPFLILLLCCKLYKKTNIRKCKLE